MEIEGDNASFRPEDIRILIVDDIPENIRLLGSILRAEGYQVIPAASGEQVLFFIARNSGKTLPV